MKVNAARLLPVTAAVALVLSACGSPDAPSAEEVPLDGPDETVDGGAMRAPTPIRAAGGGVVATATRAAGEAVLGTDAAISSEMMIAPAYLVTEFIAGEGLGALPGSTTGYVFDAGAMPTADDAARIAAAFGVVGDPVMIDDGFSVSYRVGPDDGSAASVTLWDDAMLSWNYQRAWGDEPVFGCATAGSAPSVAIDAAEGDDDAAASSVSTPGEEEPVEVELPRPDEMPADCVEPEPPVGVPSAQEAEGLAVPLLAELGVDSSALTIESWADDWSAGVTANESIAGAVTRSWGFGFGGDAELQHAWGSLATPVPVGPYDLIDLGAAVERLNDGYYGYGFPGGPGIAVLETADAATSEIAVAEPPPEDEPGAPVDDAPELEEITVTLTGVDADMWWVWDVDGSAWLVPAYAFTGDDGGVYTVPAVTDEFLVQVEPPVEPAPEPAPEPIPVEPDDGTGDGAEPLSPDATALAVVVGDPLGVFTDYAESLGFTVRVVEIDGEGLAVTEDFNPNRVNVAIVGDEDHVVRATMDDGTLVGEADTGGVTLMAITAVHEGVEYYPACGNETLEFEGVTWYPLNGDDPAVASISDAVADVGREPFPVASGFARVAPPGPGDDSGTLVIWADGVGRWVSDSGELDVWLATTEITYGWVC